MILIGTSGFSYKDWKGYVYPEGIKAGEMLSYYSKLFPAVEINSTYYRVMSPQNVERMVKKSERRVEFVMKANKEMTHEREDNANVFEAFKESLQPLFEAQVFGCVLAQFPWSFKYAPENQDYISKFKERIGDISTVIEFRNAEWVNDDVFEFLGKNGLGFCCVDEPRLKGLIPPIARATSDIGYVRFHGRNAAKWWHHKEAWERYDYLYSEEELKEWIPKIEALEKETKKTFVFANNHYQGKAAKNAQMLLDLLK